MSFEPKYKTNEYGVLKEINEEDNTYRESLAEELQRAYAEIERLGFYERRYFDELKPIKTETTIKMCLFEQTIEQNKIMREALECIKDCVEYSETQERARKAIADCEGK